MHLQSEPRSPKSGTASLGVVLLRLGGQGSDGFMSCICFPASDALVAAARLAMAHAPFPGLREQVGDLHADRAGVVGHQPYGDEVR